jgi:hypothetical protein
MFDFGYLAADSCVVETCKSSVCLERPRESGCVDCEVRICKDEVPAQKFMLTALARLRVRLGTLILRSEGGSERDPQRLSHMMLLQHLAT